MPPAELDLPLTPDADQIRRRRFASVRKGFDPDQVREYLRQVADQVEHLEEQLRLARLEAEGRAKKARAPGPDSFDEAGKKVAAILRAAEEQAQVRLREGEEEARRIVTEARAEAERARFDAQAGAEQARNEGNQYLENARSAADQALAGLTSRRDELVVQLQGIRERLVGMAQELETTDRAIAESAPGVTAIPEPSEDPPVDPRYEDLWASTETIDLNLADIPPLDVGEPGDQGTAR